MCLGGVTVGGFPTLAKGNALAARAKSPKAGIVFSKPTVLGLIGTCSGNLSRVADSIGANRDSVRRFVDRDPELQQALRDSRERLIDEVEQSVFQRAVESNDTALQCFVLKTQGRHRGWDQSEAQNTAKDIATAAFDFILNKSKNPAESAKQVDVT